MPNHFLQRKQNLLPPLLFSVLISIFIIPMVLRADEYGLVYQSESGTHTTPLLSTRVSMQVSGLINRVIVRQTFENQSEDWIHGRYVFPLPDKAGVDHLRLWIGERFIEGDIQPKEEARKQYQAAQKAGVKASLVEQHRPNIFSTEVANIAPSEKITVEIEYQETLSYTDGVFSLRFPTVVAPRYIPGVPLIVPAAEVEMDKADTDTAGSGALIHTVMPNFQQGWGVNTDQVPDANWITPYVRDASSTENDPELPLNITVELSAGMSLANIESPFHEVTKNMNADGSYTVALKELSFADRDFVLNWHPVASHQPSAALFTQQYDGKQYGLLMAMPPQQANQNYQTNGFTEPSVLSQSVTFVLDISGSMHGDSIEQAKRALKYGLGQLKPTDRFNIVTFNHQAYLYSPQAITASSTNIQQAIAFIDVLKADGGTDIASALNTTFFVRKATKETEDTAFNQIVFITDGSIGNEENLFELIEQQLGSSRLFTVGIGSAPNSYFMTRAAMKGKGTYTYIGDIADVDKQMRRLFDKIVSPVMRDIKLTWANGAEVDYWPQPLPDLYQQEPLVVSFLIPDNAPVLTISGQLQDRQWRHDVDVYQGRVINPDLDSGINFELVNKQKAIGLKAIGLNVVWARNQISSVMLNNTLSAEDKKARITQIGIDHHIVTKYTSLIAVDKTPVRQEGETITFESVKPHMPKGWIMKANSMPHQLAQTGTGSNLLMLLGALLPLFALVINTLSSLTNRLRAND